MPVEHEIDKKLGIKCKEDVYKIGIKKYNEDCRSIVMSYASQWRSTIEGMGRWIDFDNDYKTLYPSYMESVWWAFKQLYSKGLVYRGSKVMPYSTACTTPLSNFEAGQNYQNVSDPSIVVGFRLIDQPEVYMLAWTSTPWTLPSNLALCVHPDLTYIKIKNEEGRYFIILESRLVQLYKKPNEKKYIVMEKIIGKEMIGWKYEPLFDYFYNEYKDHGFIIVADEYVSADEGTGIVHKAFSYLSFILNYIDPSNVTTKETVMTIFAFFKNKSIFLNVYPICAFVYVIVFILFSTVYIIRKWGERIRDELYLVGERLNNIPQISLPVT